MEEKIVKLRPDRAQRVLQIKQRLVEKEKDRRNREKEEMAAAAAERVPSEEE